MLKNIVFIQHYIIQRFTNQKNYPFFLPIIRNPHSTPSREKRVRDVCTKKDELFFRKCHREIRTMSVLTEDNFLHLFYPFRIF